ncbi:MAG: amylo-alpha-1,6-glucosidase [Prevotella sp.]
MKKIISLIALLLTSGAAIGQTWIWFPGDMDLWTGNRINNLRTEGGGMWPAFWRADSHWQSVEYSKTVELEEDEEVEIAVEGQYSVKIDKWFLFGMPNKITIPKGKHTVRIAATNIASPPALWANGNTVKSDRTWTVSNYAEAERPDTWFDMDGSPMFDTKDKLPSQYRLPLSSVAPTSTERNGKEIFVDFGKESMGYLRLDDVKGDGMVKVWYGESEDEAHDKQWAYLQDRVMFTADSIVDMQSMMSSGRKGSYRLAGSRAMRYALVECSEGMSIGGLTLMSEMKDLGKEYRGSFVCNDTLLNKIWQVGAYTLHLTNREVMIEGIKRDRWMWSGDAIQSYLMNYYAFMDAPAVKRTIWAMRGKDPVQQHINTILDYTFYWFNSVYDYYLYTGDEDFVRSIYPRMQSLMAFVEGRLADSGMVEGQKGDWVFVDWSPGPMSKDGALSFEQMVYLRSLDAMALCASIVGNDADKHKYGTRMKRLGEKLVPLFWNEGKKAFVHTVKGGKQSEEVTRYANMFAVLYDLVDKQRGQDILQNVLLNDSIMPITTPYMRFYELEALCSLGEHNRVLKEMRNYWGGMLAEGATSFWETYDPKDTYPERLAMYGHPYGKSLCHAWGASPLYLLGKYYLGVRPTLPGYASWEAAPHLGDLEWMRGDVPTPNGSIHIEMTLKEITVKAEGCGTGTVRFKSAKRPKATGGTVKPLGEGEYEVEVEPGKTVRVEYRS